MRIGFIGAGKMGFTLGKHLSLWSSNNSGANSLSYEVIGFYSRNYESAKAAAEFTDTKCFKDLQDIVEQSDIIFITVPDGRITDISEKIDNLKIDISGKILCHTSGALSSQVFSGMKAHIYGYSVHPIYAVSSKTESYKNFSECYITIEGHEQFIFVLKDIFTAAGHRVKVIDASNKEKYHASAVFASNLVIGLYRQATKLLTQCGFEDREASEALKPLFINNATKLYQTDCTNALTGPVERNDVETVKKHLNVLTDNEKEIYRLLSMELISIAQTENRDYSEMKELLK